MKKYGLLLLATLVVGASLARLGGGRGPAGQTSPAAAAGRDTVLALTIVDGRIVPARCDVPLGTRVRLVIAGAGKTRHVSLGGYEDRVSLTVAPDSTARVVFAADRPGEDFPWLVDGQASGRMSVTGSHLVEGHR